MPKVPDGLLTADELDALNCQEFWTVSEAAAVLRVGEGFVREMIHKGVFPCHRVGTWFRIPRRRLFEALDSGALEIDPPAGELVTLP